MIPGRAPHLLHGAGARERGALPSPGRWRRGGDGGPHGQQGPVFDPRAQVFATEGWATLMVNYRGSTGYGQAFIDAISGDQNGREAMDVLQGTDAAARRYAWIDRDRMGVEGGSYGGQLTNWLVTQTDRYAAAISRAGISDLVGFNYLSYYHDYLASGGCSARQRDSAGGASASRYPASASRSSFNAVLT